MRAAGFTLIELVVVITVMAILSVGAATFIGDATDGYAATVRRSELGGTARLAAERITRELRVALPNSVRVTGGCLEFIPTEGGSTYLTLPVSTVGTTFDVVAPIDPSSAGARIAVFPDTAATVYAIGAAGVISPSAAFSAPDANNVVHVTLSSAHRFPIESPSRRFYLLRTPVSYCVDQNRLWRYQGYGFSVTQPTVAGLPTSEPGRSPIGEDVVSPAPFALSGATLTRNAEIALDLQFQDGNDVLRFQHTVQLRNVP
ncbi:MAG TPA: type II secretion system protein [Pseudomonadales bacterium]|nr:type II secretion system protein [Pseudomonadales bacterium]